MCPSLQLPSRSCVLVFSFSSFSTVPHHSLQAPSCCPDTKPGTRCPGSVQRGHLCPPAGFLGACQHPSLSPPASSGWLRSAHMLRRRPTFGGYDGVRPRQSLDVQARKWQAQWWGKSQKPGNADSRVLCAALPGTRSVTWCNLHRAAWKLKS